MPVNFQYKSVSTRISARHIHFHFDLCCEIITSLEFVDKDARVKVKEFQNQIHTMSLFDLIEFDQWVNSSDEKLMNWIIWGLETVLSLYKNVGIPREYFDMEEYLVENIDLFIPEVQALLAVLNPSKYPADYLNPY